MRFSVTVTIANLVMEDVEEGTDNYRHPPEVLKHYVGYSYWVKVAITL